MYTISGSTLEYTVQSQMLIRYAASGPKGSWRSLRHFFASTHTERERAGREDHARHKLEPVRLRERGVDDALLLDFLARVERARPGVGPGRVAVKEEHAPLERAEA